MGSSAAGTKRYSVHSETRLPLAQPTCVLWAFWNTVYVQMRCWAERGVLAAVFERWRERWRGRGSGRLGHRDGDDAGQHLGEGTCGWDG